MEYLTCVGIIVDFPWGVAIGLSIILTGVLICIVYILLLDKIES